MSSLAEAVAYGQGIERPFQCEVHDDKQASATVNVLLGVWFCHACHASGRIDPSSKRKAPSLAELAALLDPEKAPRVYPDAYLEMFDNDLGNWPTRFSDWVRWLARLGCDPLTGDATFPVRTPTGRLAGVGRRIEYPAEGEPRFRYPPRWSASSALFVVGAPSDVLSLVEGASDATAIAEAGGFAAATYGAGLHAPQYELVARLNPKLVLLCFDADEAGHRAVYGFTPEHKKKKTAAPKHSPGAKELLERAYEVGVVPWDQEGAKDAAALPVQVRLDLMSKIVGGSYYGGPKTNFAEQMTARAAQLRSDYQAYVKEING